MALASILVVDDDLEFREALCRTLRGAGHPVHEACDGAQALQVLERHAPDVVLTDLVMPNRDGIELLLSVKRTRPSLRVIAMSGRWIGGLSLLTMAGKLGADAVLAKPFDDAELFAALQGVTAQAGPGRRT